ncbi:hypothetical protein D9M68_521940 [compost metagenome]
MPPMVHCAPVDTSTGNQSPCGLSQALRWSSTMPGSTVTVRAAASKATTLLSHLLLSITSASPTVCPHWLVPAPRASTGTRWSRAMSSARSRSAWLRGTTTPIGMIW